MKTHKEKIICPNCKTKQWAIVEHTLPWYWNYTHTCKSCNYIIMESEWEEVSGAKKETGCLVIILAIVIMLLIIIIATL